MSPGRAGRWWPVIGLGFGFGFGFGFLRLDMLVVCSDSLGRCEGPGGNGAEAMTAAILGDDDDAG